MNFVVSFRFRDTEYYASIEDTLTFGNHKKDTVQIPESAHHMLMLSVHNDTLQCITQAPLPPRKFEVRINELCPIDANNEIILYVSRITGTSSTTLTLPYDGEIFCGRKPENDLVLTFPIISGKHFRISCEHGTVHIEDLNSTHHLYLNGKRIQGAIMRNGDVVSVFTFRFVLKYGVLYFENMGSSLKIAPYLLKSESDKSVESVSDNSSSTDHSCSIPYHLSPRLREQLPKNKIVLSSAPGQGTASSRRGNLAYLISSGAMMAASLATGMISPTMLLARASGMISPVVNMAMYGKMNKEEKEHLAEYERVRQERYQAYIDDQKAKIRKIADVQRRIVTSENQPPTECLETVAKLRRSLWERLPQDSDYLVTRLGIGKVPLCVEVQSREDHDGFRMTDDDELERLSEQIIEETRLVDEMPVNISLFHYHTIGIIGSPEKWHYLLRAMLVEIATQHSPNDVRIVGLFNEEALSRWGVIRWLPHIWDETGQVRYIAFNASTRHEVCEMLSDMVRHRLQVAAANPSSQEAKRVLPHYIVIVQDRNMIRREGVYDQLVSNNPSLGITTLFIGESYYDLPPTCEVIADLSEKRPYVCDRYQFDQRLFFEQDSPIHQADLEAFCRKMAAIELESGSRETQVPSSITFLEGYGVQNVEELDVLSRWKNSEPFTTLAAPIGIMEGGKIFSLDIRDGDQAHGPHGLLAGTTGSGKSELLQSWILSMAVNYHPHDVNFVIIDYKGGGMSDLMEPLPHVVGKITNIDKNIGRSLISLKSELRRRQELFAAAGVNNISKYQRAYQQGEVKERLPHLVIVTDEFAEMKKEEPEFMTELNSVAAIGRSLGIHMLLATQKPSGVVTDQINSNSRFRICMKVQDVADSREMIKRSDAAKITQSGRAYVRVGEDELLTLFQSFYSGAEYTDNRADAMYSENQVRIISVTGKRIDFQKKGKKNSGSTNIDELTAVTHYINKVCEQNGIEKMAGPWLPELPRQLSLEDLPYEWSFDGKEWSIHKKSFTIPVGKYDIPAKQKQGVLELNFTDLGHYAVYGSPSTGKTAFLKTVLVAAARCFSPDELKISVIDAGSWSMKEFESLPHIQEVLLNQESDKLAAFIVKITKEMESRKMAFLKHAVSSLKAYHETVSASLHMKLIVIDNLQPLIEEYPDIQQLVMRIAQYGAKYGIHLIFTANTTLGIPYKLTQLIKGAVSFQMTDKSDYSGIVGPIAGISLPFFPGRALYRNSPPIAFQAAFYTAEQDETQLHNAVQAFLEEISAAKNNTFSVNEEETRSSAMGESIEYQERHKIPLGIASEDLEPIVLDMTTNNLLLVCGGESDVVEGQLHLIKNLLSTMPDNQIIQLQADTWEEQITHLENLLNDRQKNVNAHRKEDDFSTKKWVNDFTQICLFIENLSAYAAAVPEKAKISVRRMISKTMKLGVIIFAGDIVERLNNPEPDLLTAAALKKQNILLMDKKPYDLRAAEMNQDDPLVDQIPDQGEAAWICHGEIKFVRL